MASFQDMQSFAVITVSAYITAITLKRVIQETRDYVNNGGRRNQVNKEASADKDLALKILQKGDAAFKEKKWNEAVTFYTVAIKLNGNDVTYFTKRATAYLEMESFNLAKEDCMAAISLDEKNVKAYLLRGITQEKLGLEKEANADFRYAVLLDGEQRESCPAWKQLADRPGRFLSVSFWNSMIYFGWQKN